jgi:hypothetical protein
LPSLLQVLFRDLHMRHVAEPHQNLQPLRLTPRSPAFLSCRPQQNLAFSKCFVLVFYFLTDQVVDALLSSFGPGELPSDPVLAALSQLSADHRATADPRVANKQQLLHLATTSAPSSRGCSQSCAPQPLPFQFLCDPAAVRFGQTSRERSLPKVTSCQASPLS